MSKETRKMDVVMIGFLVVIHGLFWLAVGVGVGKMT